MGYPAPMLPLLGYAGFFGGGIWARSIGAAHSVPQLLSTRAASLVMGAAVVSHLVVSLVSDGGDGSTADYDGAAGEWCVPCQKVRQAFIVDTSRTAGTPLGHRQYSSVE